MKDCYWLTIRELFLSISDWLSLLFYTLGAAESRGLHHSFSETMETKSLNIYLVHMKCGYNPLFGYIV
jgi:hypothetical protein